MGHPLGKATDSRGTGQKESLCMLKVTELEEWD